MSCVGTTADKVRDACPTCTADPISSRISVLSHASLKTQITTAAKSSSIVLDFTDNGNLPASLLRRLDALAESEREAFNVLLAELTRGRERNIDWWVSRPASRNTHISILFTQCMQLALVRTLLDEGANVLVKTDRPEMANVLQSVLGREAVELVLTSRRRIRRAQNALWNFTSMSFHAVAAWMAAHRTRRYARPIAPVPLSVLEVYVQRDSFAQGTFRDRYYPTLHECLSEAERSRLYYLPVCYRLRDYYATFRAMRESSRNFLIREDYLRWRDYAFAFGHWWRVSKLAGVKARFGGFDIGPLVDAELRYGRFANSALQALLFFRFWNRAMERGLAIDRFVDWYEGHDFDHATAAAINWHANAPTLIAYRSVAPASYLSVTPARHEVTSEVVPFTWGVVGGYVRTEIERANPELTVLPAPGLRYGRLREFQRHAPEGGRPITLVLLSIERDLVERVFATIAPVVDMAGPDGCRWLIKRHPAMPEAEVRAIFHSVAHAVEFVDGDFYDYLERADAVIGLGTNTLIEAVAAGVPVICVSGGNRPAEIPLPLSFRAGWWRVCYDASEFAVLLPQAWAEARQGHAGCELREALLGPFDVAAMRALLFDPLPQLRRAVSLPK